MALSNSREFVTSLPCLSEILLTVCLLVFQRLGKFIERTLSSVNQFYAVNEEQIPQPKEPHQKMWERFATRLQLKLVNPVKVNQISTLSAPTALLTSKPTIGMAHCHHRGGNGHPATLP